MNTHDKINDVLVEANREEYGSDQADARRVIVESTNSEKRRSYRYPSQEGQGAAILRRRGKTQPAALVEESAGGFALEVADSYKLDIGEKLEVGIYSGWYRAQVVHLAPTDGALRVGFRRVVAISGAAGDGEETAGRKKRDAWTSRSTVPVIAMMFCFFAVGVFAWSYVDVAGLVGLGQSAKDKAGSQSSGGWAEFQADAHMKTLLDSVNQLNTPEAAKELKLDRRQRDSLTGIFVGVSNSLGEVYEKTKNKSPDVWYMQSQAVVNAALEDVLCSLTDEQIILWRKMILRDRQEQVAAN